MCLAVPGKVMTVQTGGSPDSVGMTGAVDFQGTRLNVSLAFTPEVRVGDWVLVHAGFALQVLDEQAARETWEYLEAADIAELKEGASAGHAEGEFYHG
jgi:hydrogenase expression/formation protein HypC